MLSRTSRSGMGRTPLEVQMLFRCPSLIATTDSSVSPISVFLKANTSDNCNDIDIMNSHFGVALILTLLCVISLLWP